MSRRRSTDPTKAISITLPLTLLDKIDDKLTRKDSRSAWIAKAANAALGNSTNNLTTRQLLSMLHARLPPSTLASLIQDKYNELTSSNLSEDS
jgi:metal-responsive CopG/Arc/MetJ family transcriptional regulator